MLIPGPGSALVDNRSLRTLAQAISDDPEAGWCKLCTSEVFTLALLSPPMDAPDWFWQGLHGAAARAIVLAKDFDGSRADEGWRLDTIMTDIAPGAEDLARGPLVAALALLAAPAEQLDIEAIDPLPLPASLGDGSVVTTHGGCVIPLARAETIARELTAEQRRQAHCLAFTLLNGPRARAKMEENVNEELLRARLYHARAAGWTEAVAEASQRLMMLYRRQRRAGALLGVFEQVSDIHRRIDKVWKIGAGWAYLSVGSPDNAETWLGLAEPLELAPEDEATRLMLLAEVAKSSGRAGSKERARVDLEEALATAESGTGDDARRVALRVRHDLARLTHFLDDDAPTAVPLYESIERDWQALPHAGLDRAITLRNLAEAKMAAAEAGGAAAETALAEAEQHLDTARSLLPSNTGHPVAAELEYVRGRLATRLRLGEPEARVRFERCRTVALTTNHLMMAAIVEARLFWMDVSNADRARAFDAAAWQERAAGLQPFARHAWAARVLINGHLRSVRRLVARGERRPALRDVVEAKRWLDVNPAFNRGDDRRRVAATYAGLALLGNDGVDWWSKLPADHGWAAAWLAERAITGAGAAWALVD